MTGGESIFFSFAAMTAVAAASLMIAAIATPDWYEVHSGHTHQRVGFFEFCNITGGPIPYERCFSSPFSEARGSAAQLAGGGPAGDYVATYCNVAKSTMESRQAAAIALSIIASIFMLVVAILMGVGWCFRRFANIVVIASMVLVMVAIVFMIASICVICLFFEKYYYCGTDYCSYAVEHLGATNCAFFYGYAFVYGVIAAILAFLSLCVLGALLFHRCSDPISTREERSRLRRQEEGDAAEEGHSDDSFDYVFGDSRGGAANRSAASTATSGRRNSSAARKKRNGALSPNASASSPKRKFVRAADSAEPSSPNAAANSSRGGRPGRESLFEVSRTTETREIEMSRVDPNTTVGTYNNTHSGSVVNVSAITGYGASSPPPPPHQQQQQHSLSGGDFAAADTSAATVIIVDRDGSVSFGKAAAGSAAATGGAAVVPTPSHRSQSSVASTASTATPSMVIASGSLKSPRSRSLPARRAGSLSNSDTDDNSAAVLGGSDWVRSGRGNSSFASARSASRNYNSEGPATSAGAAAAANSSRTANAPDLDSSPPRSQTLGGAANHHNYSYTNNPPPPTVGMYSLASPLSQQQQQRVAATPLGVSSPPYGRGDSPAGHQQPLSTSSPVPRNRPPPTAGAAPPPQQPTVWDTAHGRGRSVVVGGEQEAPSPFLDNGSPSYSLRNAHRPPPTVAGSPSAAGGGGNNNRSFHSLNTTVHNNSTTLSALSTSAAERGVGFWPSDWVFHADSRLYWSAAQQLYLDPATEHYYDPHSNKWFDPRQEVWYSKHADANGEGPMEGPPAPRSPRTPRSPSRK